MLRYKFAIIIVSLLFVVGCARPEGKTPSAKRSSILQVHNQTLSELYSKQPQSRSQIINAAGYAVFSNVDTTVLFVGGGGGYGVAVDKKNGKKTYMKMGQASVGLGVGLKD